MKAKGQGKNLYLEWVNCSLVIAKDCNDNRFERVDSFLSCLLQ